jgi:trehalose-6-phosphate synthase
MANASNGSPAITTSDLRLLVVSNRLPLTISKDEKEYSFKLSSGGLVSALSGLKKMMTFTWIGWPGQFHNSVVYVDDVMVELIFDCYHVTINPHLGLVFIASNFVV